MSHALDNRAAWCTCVVILSGVGGYSLIVDLGTIRARSRLDEQQYLWRASVAPNRCTHRKGSTYIVSEPVARAAQFTWSPLAFNFAYTHNVGMCFPRVNAD